MQRINVTARDEVTGELDVIGWFDRDRATSWGEGTRWDGSNNVSLATGVYSDHEELLRTAQGRWVIHSWSQWVNIPDSWRYIPADAARQWLIANQHSAATIVVEAGLGDIPDESGPNLGGRPAIGGLVSLALGDDLLRRLDAEGDRRGVKRAALVRDLLAAALR